MYIVIESPVWFDFFSFDCVSRSASNLQTFLHGRPSFFCLWFCCCHAVHVQFHVQFRKPYALYSILFFLREWLTEFFFCCCHLLLCCLKLYLRFFKSRGNLRNEITKAWKSRFFVEQIRLFIYSYCVPKSPALLGTSFVGKDEVPGPNPGISSIKSPSDINAEGDFLLFRCLIAPFQGKNPRSESGDQLQLNTFRC